MALIVSAQVHGCEWLSPKFERESAQLAHQLIHDIPVGLKVGLGKLDCFEVSELLDSPARSADRHPPHDSLHRIRVLDKQISCTTTVNTRETTY